MSVNRATNRREWCLECSTWNVQRRGNRSRIRGTGHRRVPGTRRAPVDLRGTRTRGASPSFERAGCPFTSLASKSWWCRTLVGDASFSRPTSRKPYMRRTCSAPRWRRRKERREGSANLSRVGTMDRSVGRLPQDNLKRCHPDTTRARKVMGWEPRMFAREGLEYVVEDHPLGTAGGLKNAEDPWRTRRALSLRPTETYSPVWTWRRS